MEGVAPLGAPWPGSASFYAPQRPPIGPTPQTPSSDGLPSFDEVLHLTPKAGLMTKYACPVCGKEFLNKKDFRRHYMTHTGEKPYHCPLCSYRAGQKSSVQRHINLIHARDAPLPGGERSQHGH